MTHGVEVYTETCEELWSAVLEQAINDVDYAEPIRRLRGES